MNKNKIEFPIANKEILNKHFQNYKKEHGSIKKCLTFFENLSEPTKKEIYKLIKIGEEDIDNIRVFVEMLYAARSEFAHECYMSLEIGDWYHYGQYNGKRVFWKKFKLKYLLTIFEEGVIFHFNQYAGKKLHNKAFKADSQRLTV
jgi:hypothetical protein